MKRFILLKKVIKVFLMIVFAAVSFLSNNNAFSRQPDPSKRSKIPVATQQWLRKNGACSGKNVTFFKESAASDNKVRELPEHVINKHNPEITHYTFCRCIEDFKGIKQPDDYNFSTIETVVLKNGRAFVVSNSGWESIYLTYTFYLPDNFFASNNVKYWYAQVYQLLKDIRPLSRSYPENDQKLTSAQQKTYGDEGLADEVFASVGAGLKQGTPKQYGQDVDVNEMQSFYIASVKPVLTEKQAGRTVVFVYRYGPL
jgi:hypothetical protein